MHVLPRPQETQNQLDGLSPLPDGEPAIDAWLGVMSRLMHLPERTRTEICSELREHLRERVRDLLLAGNHEREAVRQAIDELGETAQLARRFEAANTPPRRRLLMHAILTLVGGGALAAGIMTFTPNNNGEANMARFGEATSVQETPKSLADARLTLAVDTNMRDAVEAAAKQTKMGLMVDWGAMEEAGIDLGNPMGLSFNELAAPRALTMIAQTAGNGMTALDWRVREGGVIEFGLRHDLDAREIELVTYDITDTINLIAGNFTDSKEAAAQQVTELIASLVTPDYWNENGGDLAQMKLVGGRLFVEAPSRTHAKVKWILDQLPQVRRDEAKAAADGQVVPVLSDVPILNDFFAQPAATDDAAMSDARSELESARSEFEIVKSRYREGSMPYQHAEARLELAEAAFARLQSPSQPQPQPLNLKPGDVLTIEVLDLLQPGQWYAATREIEPDGMVRFPLVGEISTTRLSAREVEARVIELLSDRLNDPKVSVYRSRADISAASGGETVAR